MEHTATDTPTSFPPPVTLTAADDVDAVAAERLRAHFGSGQTAIGVTALSRHASIHRADLTLPRLPHCGMISHGELSLMVRVYALTDDTDVGPVARLLTEAGVLPCRMCRRCWKPRAHKIPSHGHRCFRGTPID